MFHLQKSSKSSADDNLQINLLYQKDRQSRIDIIRPQNRINNPRQIMMNPLKRGSQHIPHRKQFQSDRDSVHGNYSVLAAQKIDLTSEILTNSGQNNRIVGILLFLVLIAFTPLQTYALSISRSTLQITNLISMMEFLIICQLIAFGVLYYFKWVDQFFILKKYLSKQRQTQNTHTFISKLINHPYIFFLTVLILTVIWEISYAMSILHGQTNIYAVLFYMIILPQISVSLYFDQSTFNASNPLFFIVILAYLFVCAFLTDPYILSGTLSGILLIYFSARAGRICVLIQYLTKILLFIILIFTTIFGVTGHFYEQQTFQNGGYIFGILFILTLVTTMSIIIVRCLNNKIFRIELYKYFYSDTFINAGLLTLPLILCYIENRKVNVWICLIGCGILLGLIIKISKGNQQINFDINLDDNNGQFQKQTKV